MLGYADSSVNSSCSCTITSLGFASFASSSEHTPSLLSHTRDIHNVNDNRITHTQKSPFPGLPGSASTRNVKPIWILLKQETVSGSGISWVICKSALRSRQITTPTPHHSSFFTGRMPFLLQNKSPEYHKCTEAYITAYRRDVDELVHGACVRPQVCHSWM